MSVMSSFCYLCFLLVLALSHSCISNQTLDNKDLSCIESERQALLRFKHGLIDKTDRLASWVGEDRNCCRWAAIVCDNITGHVNGIHLRGSSPLDGDFDPTQHLGGILSSSLLHLKQLTYLDLSCNNFRGIQVPEFIGSLRNLRYLNLSVSRFSGIFPPQLGNLSRLLVLSVGSFHVQYPNEDTRLINMQWLSSLRLLHHLDMSGVNLRNVTGWFQVINTLPSLTELHLSDCELMDIHPYVPSLNITSLSLLDLSDNIFGSFVPQWIFSLTNLVSLDLTGCGFHSFIRGNIDGFRNLTSLKLLHVSGNDIMNSSLVLKGMSSTVAGNLVSLRIGSCGISSSVLNSLHNLTSLLSLDLSGNKLTSRMPKSFVSTSNLRDIDLSLNEFGNISLNNLLGGFLECKKQICPSSPLEKLDVRYSDISGTIPYFIGQLTSMRRLLLSGNRISGPIPHSIGQLSSLEELQLSNNRLDGSLPDQLGNLSKLEWLSFSYNLLTGVITEAHFTKLVSLIYLDGKGNNLTLRPLLSNPPFQLRFLDLSSWSLGPHFPLWLHSQTHLTTLLIKNTGICSAMPDWFWKSSPNLTILDMSHNRIHGTLLDIPEIVTVLDLNSNAFRGELPKLSDGSLLEILDLSSNFFVGSVHRLLCSYSVKKYPDGSIFGKALNLGNNHFSGVIPECWDKWQDLDYLNMENNQFSGEIPETLGTLSRLRSLNMHGNKLSGRIPASLVNLKYLEILQIGKNEFVGSIPKWFGNLSSLRILNLRSNNFVGNIPYEICYLTHIQILDLANNDLSGNIPRCFNNFSVLSGKEVIISNEISFLYYSAKLVSVSDSLVMKGREDKYNTILGLVMLLDLSCNNLVGPIPSELMALSELKSLNLSRNQLTGMIPEKIGDLKSLENLDVSMNKLSGKLPLSLSKLTFLLRFNVSWNQLTGRVPSSTQLQSFDESSFFGNKLCGDPLTDRCIPSEVSIAEFQKEDDVSHGADWGLVASIVVGIVVGFWLIVAPLMVSRAWRIAYFRFLSELGYMGYDVFRKYAYGVVSMFSK